jgi:hypothetical protein
MVKRVVCHHSEQFVLCFKQVNVKIDERYEVRKVQSFLNVFGHGHVLLLSVKNHYFSKAGSFLILRLGGGGYSVGPCRRGISDPSKRSAFCKVLRLLRRFKTGDG